HVARPHPSGTARLPAHDRIRDIEQKGERWPRCGERHGGALLTPAYSPQVRKAVSPPCRVRQGVAGRNQPAVGVGSTRPARPSGPAEHEEDPQRKAPRRTAKSRRSGALLRLTSPALMGGRVECLLASRHRRARRELLTALIGSLGKLDDRQVAEPPTPG